MLRTWWHQLLKPREGATRRPGRAPRRPRGLCTYRPDFDVLEGRLTPSALPALSRPGASAAGLAAQGEPGRVNGAAHAAAPLRIALRSASNTAVDLLPSPVHNSLTARVSLARLNGFLVIANRTDLTVGVKVQGRGPRAFLASLPGSDFLFIRPPPGNGRVVITVTAASTVPSTQQG